jgi:hypothetical protein
MNRHCQEKKRFSKESVHIPPIGGKLAALTGPEFLEKPAIWGRRAGL